MAAISSPQRCGVRALCSKNYNNIILNIFFYCILFLERREPVQQRLLRRNEVVGRARARIRRKGVGRFSGRPTTVWKKKKKNNKKRIIILINYARALACHNIYIYIIINYNNILHDVVRVRRHRQCSNYVSRASRTTIDVIGDSCIPSLDKRTERTINRRR